MKRTKIGAAFDGESKEWLVDFFTKNRDIFEWTLADMLERDLDFWCHRLSIASRTRSVEKRNRGRRLGKEEQRVAREETNKLLAANFIREILILSPCKVYKMWLIKVQYHTWLANVIMVKKPNDK
ncbi:hypothetical protein CR513_33414, partial [Mucuna pruriens]